jgi:hypothetical protein
VTQKALCAVCRNLGDCLLVYLTKTYLNCHQTSSLLFIFSSDSSQLPHLTTLPASPTLCASMMLRILQVVSALVIPTLVSAHGYLQQVTIDGTVYMGNKLNVKTPAPSIIRLVNTNFPVMGTSNPYMNCGPDAQFASQVGNANPGSRLQLLWVGGTDGSYNVCDSMPILWINELTANSQWLHNIGPLMHYMTMCEGSCSTYNSTYAEWFKISELGLESDGKTWYQDILSQYYCSFALLRLTWICSIPSSSERDDSKHARAWPILASLGDYLSP